MANIHTPPIDTSTTHRLIKVSLSCAWIFTVLTAHATPPAANQPSNPAANPRTTATTTATSTQPAEEPRSTLWSLTPEGQADYTNQRVVLVYPTTFRQIRALHNIADIWTHTPVTDRPVVARVDAHDIPALEAMGLAPQIIVEDVAEFVRAERQAIDDAADIAREQQLTRNLDTFYDTYRTLVEIETRLDQVVADHPDITTPFTAGNSLQNRPIRGVRLRGTGGDQSPRPSILWNGCLHAREWISPMVVLSLLDNYTDNYGTNSLITQALDSIDIIIVPVVNPDGYLHSWNTQRFWRKNRRPNQNFTVGVDLNRNFAFEWGGPGSSSSGGSETFRGTAPFSEPEAAVMRDLINAEHDLIAHIDFHSFGQLILWPYGGLRPAVNEPDLTNHRNLARTMADEVLGNAGAIYDPRHGPGLYIASGTMADWTYSRGGAISYTFELRPTGGQGSSGFDPPPSQIRPTADEMFIAMREFVGFLTEPVRITPTDPTPLIVDRLGSTSIDILIEPGLNKRPIDRVELLVRPLGQPAQERILQAVHIEGPLWRAHFGEFALRTCNKSIEYAIEAFDDTQRVSRWPVKQGAGPIWEQSTVRNIMQVRFDDFEQGPAGWTPAAETTDPYTGLWELGKPEQTHAQLGHDRTLGNDGSAWITGLMAGANINSNDVDGGPLTLISPNIPWTPPPTLVSAAPFIELWYFVSNDQGVSPYMDRLFIQVSADESPWRNIPIPEQNLHRWSRLQFSPNAAGEFPADNLRLRFVIEDMPPDSTVEAGIDDVRFAFTGCPSCSGDITGDGVFVDDYFAFLSAFFSGSPLADVDDNPGVTVEDYFIFLNGFFACLP